MVHVSEVTVEILRDEALILEARRLHGERYLEAGFVDELSSDGTIRDRWVSISTYFGAIAADGSVVGVARLIPHTWLGLPALESFRLTASGAATVKQIPESRLVEVSALAVARGQSVSSSSRVAKALYRGMYQHSVVTAGHTHWCAALDVRVKSHLMNTYNFLFEDIGEVGDYLGSPTAPVVLDLLGQARHFAVTAPERNEFFLSGLIIDLRRHEVRLEVARGGFLPSVRRFARQ